jgi:hypothetical protein
VLLQCLARKHATNRAGLAFFFKLDVVLHTGEHSVIVYSATQLLLAKCAFLMERLTHNC